MAEYARIVTFEADAAALEAMVNTIGSHDRPPDGVPATQITVLANRSTGTILVDVRFGSEDDLRAGAAALEAMSPPTGLNMRRVSVVEYEVVLDRQAP